MCNFKVLHKYYFTYNLQIVFRNGNEHVRERYDCQYLRNAAIEVTKITTGKEPHPKKPIYGERALDISFDFSGIAGGRPSKELLYYLNSRV